MMIEHPDDALEFYFGIVDGFAYKVPSHPNPIHKIITFYTIPIPDTKPIYAYFLNSCVAIVRSILILIVITIQTKPNP